MIKVSTAFEMSHKYITRNNLLMEIYDLYEDITRLKIEIAKDLKSFYGKQRGIITEINKLEKLQSTEYSLDRKNEISVLMSGVGDYKKSQTIIDMLGDIEEKKAEILYKKETIKLIHKSIPNEGVVTNYKISPKRL